MRKTNPVQREDPTSESILLKRTEGDWNVTSYIGKERDPGKDPSHAWTREERRKNKLGFSVRWNERN